MKEVKIDRKLDNRREPLSIQLFYYGYSEGDKKITTKTLMTSTRSGYCVDTIDGGINIDDIGKLRRLNVNGQTYRFEVYCYPHGKYEARQKLINALAQIIKVNCDENTKLSKAIQSIH